MSQLVLMVADQIRESIELGRSLVESLKGDTNLLIGLIRKRGLPEEQAAAWEAFSNHNHDLCVLSKEIETYTAGNDAESFGPAEAVFEQFLVVARDFLATVDHAIEQKEFRQTRRILVIVQEARDVVGRIEKRLFQLIEKRERIPVYQRGKAALIRA